MMDERMKVSKKILFGFLILILIFIVYSLIKPSPAEQIIWGVSFSQKHADHLGLSWREAYIALLDDLKVKNIKLLVHWDLIEPQKDNYYFDDLDWQINKAENYGARILLVIGMKTGRWPECHEPRWIRNQKSKIKNQKLLEYIKKVVNRYKDSKAIWAWQVENEPFFPFGECPKIKKDFVKKEIALVRSLDPNRPIVVSDSGEFSFWITSAKLGDILGTTIYRKTWSKELKIYITHHWFKPIYYWSKAQVIKKLFRKKVINVELQTEPWCFVLLYDCPVKEQKKTMNLEQFRKNIEFAKKTGLDTFYLWGAEWWFWMKETQNQPEIWWETKKLFAF